MLIKVNSVTAVVGDAMFGKSEEQEEERDGFRNKVMDFVKNVQQTGSMKYATDIIKKVL